MSPVRILVAGTPDWRQLSRPASPVPAGGRRGPGDHDAALIPAGDGGYVLLGLRAFNPSLFADLPWSTPGVTRLTLARIQALNWRGWIGEERVDIEEPADLVGASRDSSCYFHE